MTAGMWQGVTRCGGAEAGLPAWVEARYRQGWRHMVLTAVGDSRAAARTGPADDGGRTWYAGTA